MKRIKDVLSYLQEKKLILTTAESCTAGQIIHLLAQIPGSGESLDAGYVVYSEDAKKRILNVKQTTIDHYSLTSEAVAREMVEGALAKSPATVAVATTGIAGPEPLDDIPAGTICLSWGLLVSHRLFLFSETKHFSGSRSHVLTQAATYALVKIPMFHQVSLQTAS